MRVPQPMIFPSGQSATKLYISNLDYGVSNEDIKVLFSEVGELERYTIHYDRSGRSKGTAEVVFVSQTDALTAMKRYNNVHLDGKPLRIELVGVNLLPPLPPPHPVPQTIASNTGKPDSGFRSGRQITGVRGQEWGHGRGLGGNSGFARAQARGRSDDKKLTAEELDADLDKYRLQSKAGEVIRTSSWVHSGSLSGAIYKRESA
uniref:Uncharacterized protein MANES_07G113400 n=1 Tax=Rhizophora mucronata TaxID=61149 RepID=A0A2P2JUT6_RHIMU